MSSMAVPLFLCIMMPLWRQTCSMRYNFTVRVTMPSEMPTTVHSTSFQQRIADWFLEGSIWKIAMVVAGGLLIISLTILTTYRVRKRRNLKESMKELSMDISVPKDGTFMGSKSGDVLLTAEMQECTSTTKPRLKSKMMKSFKREDKNDGDDHKYSFSSRSESTASSHYGEELTQINKIRSASLRNQNNTLTQSKQEAIYENHGKVSLKRKSQPVYQNTHDRWNNAQSGKVDEVIYQNASASGAPLCHGYINSQSTLKQQKGYRDSYNDLEYAVVSH